MAPAALWAALAVGLHLCASGHAVPAQVASRPYAPGPGHACQEREYYNKKAGMCCSLCQPGHHAKETCTNTSDTVCAPCEDSTYTRVWNWVSECLSCGSRCSFDQVETQTCAPTRNRVCSCRPGWYCVLRNRDQDQGGCRMCMSQSKCGPGYGVARPGTATSDVVCAPCPRGTFSNTTSSTDTCRPHRNCSVVAVPGSASKDAVCASVPSVSPTLRVALRSTHVLQPVSMSSQTLEPAPGPSMAAATKPQVSAGAKPPAEGVSVAGISLPIGLIVGLTALGLLVLGLVNCVILTQKKKPSCLRREVKVPHLPADKAKGAQVLEQQHLLTVPSSSSSSLESSASAADRSPPAGNQPPAAATGEARASASGSSETAPGGHGTQVSVTCIVNVCSSSEHGLQCSSQAGTSKGGPGTGPSASPPKDEKVPFSREERPFQSILETPETLPQSFEKPLPLGVPDAGMKPS